MRHPGSTLLDTIAGSRLTMCDLRDPHVCHDGGSMGTISDAAVGDILSKLAQQLFPLERWLKDAQKYVPPNAAELPWRNGGPALSVTSLHVIERFEQLIDGSGPDEHLRVRWNKVMAAPLWLEPDLPHPADWRTQRKLDEAAVFAPVDSDNFVIATDDPKTKVKRPRARAEFYAACWPLLRRHRPSAFSPTMRAGLTSRRTFTPTRCPLGRPPEPSSPPTSSSASPRTWPSACSTWRTPSSLPMTQGACDNAPC